MSEQANLPGVPSPHDGLLDYGPADYRAMEDAALRIHETIVAKHSCSCSCPACRIFSILWAVSRVAFPESQAWRSPAPGESLESLLIRDALSAVGCLSPGRVERGP